MATYINYGEGEDDAMVQGAEWLQTILQSQQGSEGFLEKFKALHAENENSRTSDYGPLFDLFVDHSEHLFAAIPESRPDERVKEVESFFSLVMSMLMLLEDVKHLDQATTRLCELLSASADQQPELRLRLLMMLYNTFNNPTFEFRFRVFKYIVNYAAKAGHFDQVMPYLDYLDNWMVDWEPYITVDDKRETFRNISRYIRELLNKRMDAFLMLKRYHLLFQGQPAAALNAQEVQEATVELIKDAVQIPSVMQFDDILAFDTVKALAKSKHADLVELCKVFLSGTVNDLRTFQQKHASLFEQHGISQQDALSKIRLLTIASLAHGKSEMSLSDVAKAIEESEENIERWVVRAISEGVIDGRIDQLNRKVLVKSVFQRKFEKEEWTFLDSKLSQWIENLEHVIKFIGEQKAAREGVL